MCKIGDIILVDEYASQGHVLTRHSFVVINDEEGEMEGLRVDFTSLVMSSFKNKDQKARKLKYPGNFPIPEGGSIVPSGNNREGYIKADQIYYFNKNKVSYRVIGYVTEDVFESLREFMEDLPAKGVLFEHITDNL